MPILSFNTLRRYAVIGFIACAASWAPFASAQSQPPVVVMNSLPMDSPAAYQFTGTEQRGPIFQTGPVATLIRELTFGFDVETFNRTATLSLYQLDNTTNFPSGPALASTTIELLGSGEATTEITYNVAQLGTIATTAMQPNQKYALILSNASAYAGLTDGSGSFEFDMTYSEGFSLAGLGSIDSDDAGATWQDEPTIPAFRMSVSPVDPVVPPTATLTCTPTELLAVAGQVSTCTVTLSAPSTTDTPINLTLPAANPGYTTTCTSPLVVPANATQAACTITAVANTTPGAPDVTADLAIAPPTTPDAYTAEGPAAQITIRADDTAVPPVTNPTPVPTLGTVGLVSLVSVMGLLGLRRSRKPA